MIYCIYKIEHAAFSCWPGKPDAQGEKVAEVPWMLWLTYAVAVVEPVLSPWATLQCHPLIACCTADAKKKIIKMQKVLEPSWNVCGGWTAESTWVKTGTFTEYYLVADAQLPTVFSLCWSQDMKVCWVWWKREFWKVSGFLARAALKHVIFAAMTVNQCPFFGLIIAFFLNIKTWNAIMW